MSREIKFRAWDKDLKKYVYISETIDGEFWINNGISSEEMPLHRGAFEQYTGLTDKNGKEIYEGDIFRNTINGGTWRVSWNENDAAFWVDSGVAGCSLGEFDWDRSNRKCGFIRKNCEIIGNIHENPELLGGEE